MPRTPEETERGLQQIWDYYDYEFSFEPGHGHVDAPPEGAERLRKLVNDLCSAADSLEQLAADLELNGRYDVAWAVYSLASDAMYYLVDSSGGFGEVDARVAGILDGSLVTE
jgi:hypothetical protein